MYQCCLLQSPTPAGCGPRRVQEALHGPASKPCCFGSQAGFPGVTAPGFVCFQRAASLIAHLNPEPLRAVVRGQSEAKRWLFLPGI